MGAEEPDDVLHAVVVEVVGDLDDLVPQPGVVERVARRAPRGITGELAVGDIPQRRASDTAVWADELNSAVRYRSHRIVAGVGYPLALVAVEARATHADAAPGHGAVRDVEPSAVVGPRRQTLRRSCSPCRRPARAPEPAGPPTGRPCGWRSIASATRRGPRRRGTSRPPRSRCPPRQWPVSRNAHRRDEARASSSGVSLATQSARSTTVTLPGRASGSRFTMLVEVGHALAPGRTVRVVSGSDAGAGGGLVSHTTMAPFELSTSTALVISENR